MSPVGDKEGSRTRHFMLADIPAAVAGLPQPATLAECSSRTGWRRHAAWRPRSSVVRLRRRVRREGAYSGEQRRRGRDGHRV